MKIHVKRIFPLIVLLLLLLISFVEAKEDLSSYISYEVTTNGDIVITNTNDCNIIGNICIIQKNSDGKIYDQKILNNLTFNKGSTLIESHEYLSYGQTKEETPSNVEVLFDNIREDMTGTICSIVFGLVILAVVIFICTL